MTGADDVDETADDLAEILALEFETWFRNLGPRGLLPRAFTGVTEDGRQAIVVLSDFSFEHVQQRDFMIWLCRTEQFVAYAYGTHVGILNEEDSTVSEAIDIHASSDTYDVSKTLGINFLSDGTFELFDRHHVIMPARPESGIFLGLQRSTRSIPHESEEQFCKAWADARAHAWWRHRQGKQILN
jgi:hypothetical protein